MTRENKKIVAIKRVVGWRQRYGVSADRVCLRVLIEAAA